MDVFKTPFICKSKRGFLLFENEFIDNPKHTSKSLIDSLCGKILPNQPQLFI